MALRAWRIWPGDQTGKTVLVPGSPRITQLAADLVAAGFERARTGALTSSDATLLRTEGWEVAGRLRVLQHGLDRMARPRAPRLRRGTVAQLPAIAEVDRSAFPVAWQLGLEGLTGALRATRISRLRIHQSAGDIVAFAISGVSGRDGYLQRLAVAETQRRTGLGRQLTLDSLRWMRRRGARRALVNTYEGNDAAVELYRSVGFVEQPSGLVVLSIDL